MVSNRNSEVMTDSSNNDPRYKVGKVIERHSLDGMGHELESYWAGDAEISYSLRELADYFNRELLRSVLTDRTRQNISSDVETTYRLLTGDDVSRGDEIRVRKELERDGIDVEQLEQDFVTHQAIHTYLTKGRGVTREVETGDRIENARGTLDRLRSRLIAVTETTLTNLSETGPISLGSFDIFVDIHVHCADCGTHSSLSELLDDRGCDCEGERDD